MLALTIFFLALLAVIAYLPKQAMQVLLVAAWCTLALATPVALVVELLR